MPKNLGHIASLARSYTRTAIKTLAGIMMEPNSPPMARIAAAKVLLDRGWGKCSETHNINLDGETSLLKVVNEIVHVHETREQIEFRDQTPLLELTPEDTPTPDPPNQRNDRSPVQHFQHSKKIAGKKGPEHGRTIPLAVKGGIEIPECGP